MQIFRGVPKQNKVPIALTLGNFDGVHLGHQTMLARLKKAAAELNILAGVLTFEPYPREFFTPHEVPARLTSLREKLHVCAQHGIDRVYVCRFNRRFADLSAADFIEQLHQLQVKWLLVGDDFRFGKNRSGDLKTLQDSAKQAGFDVTSVDSVLVNNKRVSSTVIREELTQGDLETAAEFLGRPYSMIGRVTHGNKIGRAIGFPTANILVKHNRVPFYGIFVVKVMGISKYPLPAVASLGIRPTLKEPSKPVLEVHILNFNEQIYGRYIEVQFLKKLRNEEKYIDLKKLTEQIVLDVEETKKYFLVN